RRSGERPAVHRRRRARSVRVLRYRSRVRITCALMLMGLVGCRRRDDAAAAPHDGGGEAVEAASAIDAAAMPVPEPAPPTLAPDTRTEARRVRVTKPEDLAALRPNAALVREHFGGATLDVQVAPLASGARAVLAGANGDDPKPLVLVVDAS